MPTPKDAPYKQAQRSRKTRMVRDYPIKRTGRIALSDGTIYEWRNGTRLFVRREVTDMSQATASERRKLKRYQLAKEKLPHLADEKLRDFATTHEAFLEMLERRHLTT